MKNCYYLKIITLLVFFTAISSTIFAQKGVSNWIEEVRKNNKFSDENVVNSSKDNAEDSELKRSKSLDLDLSKLLNLWEKPRPTVMLTIPIGGRNTPVAVELARIQITTSDFKVSTNSALNKPSKIDEGVHYRGIVKGDAESVVAISIYKEEIRGFISDKTGKYEIGKVKNNASKYVVYEEKDLKATQPFACGSDSKTIAKNGRLNSENLKIASTSGVGCKTVGVYFECDYQMYLDNGSNVTNVTNYVTSFFNQVATLYQNENIDLQISQIYVWTTPDPYRALTTTSSVLQAFDVNRGSNYTGDLAHLLTTRNLGGGIAYVNTLCNKAYAHGVSMIYNTFATYPTYSWTVECVAHELGHNLGLNHTQWCGWTKPDGTTGPIDNCYAPEGGCTTIAPAPTNGGTIMSYCHLTSVGINFANGFGTLPGNALRLSVTNATCLATGTSTAAAPTGQQTTNILTNGATLSWNAVPNVVSYSVDYKPTSSTTWTTLGNYTTTASAVAGLSAGTNYDWRVKGDCSSYSTTTSFVTAGTSTCAAPTGLSTSNIAPTSATLAWTAVSGATNYVVQYKTSAATTWTTAATVTTTNYALTALTASTAYNWQVKASCSGYSATTNFSTIASTCAAPTGLSTTNIAATSVTLVWSAVSGATNYVVQYKTSAATTWTTAATVTTTNYALTALTASTAYNWQVKASCSGYSATTNFSTIASTCAAPTGLSTTNIAATSATLAWTAVSGATNYIVQYKTSAATTWTTAATVTTTNYALTALIANTAYNWQVKASCSGYSATTNFSTIASTCAAPIGLSTTNIAATSATLVWSAVSGATNYVVQYKTSAATTWTTAATVTTTNYALTGLTASTAYNWQVKASCSGYSVTTNFSTIASTCAAPTGLSTTNITGTSATLVWNSVSGATNYVVQYKTSAATTWTTAATITTTNYALTALTASTAYNWQVKASCSGYSVTTNFSTIASTCAAPTGLSTSNIAATSATLAWTAVSGATNYVVQYKKSSTTTWTTAATVTTTNYNLAGLTASTAYNWQVKASCSGYSATTNFSTTTPACNAPTGLSTTNISGNSVKLSWNSVSGASNYTIQYKTSAATTWTTAASVTNTNNNLTGLVAGTAYNWQVKASCSGYSATTNFSTTTPACAAPSGLSTTNIAATSATLVWNSVNGATNYVVQYKKSSTTTWTTAATVTTTNYNLAALTASTAYNWKVKASCSGYSATKNFSTIAAAATNICVAPIGLLSTNLAINSVTLSWNMVSGATNYTLQYKISTATTWATAGTFTANAYSLTGLVKGKSYDWRVKANCSEYSSTAVFSTPAANTKAKVVFLENDFFNEKQEIFTPFATNHAKFNVYPNPAQDNILLNISNDDEIGVESMYRIIDFRGNVRKLQNIKESSEKIDISNLENGTYIIQMISKSGIIESKTLIKEQ